MNARSRRSSRNASVDGRAERVRQPGALRLASVLLLSLPAAWTGADDGCDTPMMDDLLWNSTQCEFVQNYLNACGSQGRHVRKARECIEWDKVKKCDDLEKVLAFKKLFKDGVFALDADACIARLNVGKLLQACRLHHAIETKFECFQEVLERDRHNIEALAGIDKIRKDILTSADEAMANEDVAAVESAINDLEMLFPRDKALKDLRAGLAELIERIAIKQARNALEDRVRELIAERKFEEALEELRKGSAQGVTGKKFESLRSEATEGLAELAKSRQAREQALAEARRLREAEDFDGARRKLKEGRALGVPEKTYDSELKAIEKAENRRETRETALAEARRLREAEDFDGARRKLKEGRALGVPEKTYDSELEAIQKAENRLRAREAALAEAQRLREAKDFDGAREKLEEARRLTLPENAYLKELEAINEAEKDIRRLAELLRECMGHMDGAQMVDALTCYRRVLELAPGHREAKKQVALLGMLVTWLEVDSAGTVRRYYAFELEFKERSDLGTWAARLTQLAREKLNSKQDEFWNSVKASRSREMYELYRTIFPEGRYVREAGEWLENEG